MSLWDYLYNVLRALDQLLNAIFAGNSRETVSARAYEAAVLNQLWYWKPIYLIINAGAYGLRWLLARPLGYHWGEDMPVNHCKDAFDSDPDEKTY